MTNQTLPISTIDTENDAIFMLAKLAESLVTIETYIITVDRVLKTLEAAGNSDGLDFIDEKMISECWEDYKDGI